VVFDETVKDGVRYLRDDLQTNEASQLERGSRDRFASPNPPKAEKAGTPHILVKVREKIAVPR